MKTEQVITVVVDSPIKTEAVDVLQAQTDLKIELALASSTKIRELIRQVYARAAAQDEGERPAPASITDVFSMALDATSKRFRHFDPWSSRLGLVRRRRSHPEKASRRPLEIRAPGTRLALAQ